MRKQAKMTLKCMQALVRVQARVLDQRTRLSHEGSRKSAFSDTNSVWESRYLQDISDRKSMVSYLDSFSNTNHFFNHQQSSTFHAFEVRKQFN